MTIGIDTSRIHSETYKEYCKHEESWYSYEHFLLVKILRLQSALKKAIGHIEWVEMDIEDMCADARMLGGY